MKRKEIKARTIKQDNDTTCFQSPHNPSKHNKKAKRLSSRRLRAICKKEDRQYE